MRLIECEACYRGFLPTDEEEVLPIIGGGSVVKREESKGIVCPYCGHKQVKTTLMVPVQEVLQCVISQMILAKVPITSTTRKIGLIITGIPRMLSSRNQRRQINSQGGGLRSPFYVRGQSKRMGLCDIHKYAHLYGFDLSYRNKSKTKRR